jgi:hypothetical protein
MTTDINSGLTNILAEYKSDLDKKWRYQSEAKPLSLYILTNGHWEGAFHTLALRQQRPVAVIARILRKTHLHQLPIPGGLGNFNWIKVTGLGPLAWIVHQMRSSLPLLHIELEDLKVLSQFPKSRKDIGARCTSDTEWVEKDIVCHLELRSAKFNFTGGQLDIDLERLWPLLLHEFLRRLLHIAPASTSSAAFPAQRLDSPVYDQRADKFGRALAAVQLSFSLRTSSDVKTVHLFGSWDNYNSQLPLAPPRAYRYEEINGALPKTAPTPTAHNSKVDVPNLLHISHENKSELSSIFHNERYNRFGRAMSDQYSGDVSQTPARYPRQPRLTIRTPTIHNNPNSARPISPMHGNFSSTQSSPPNQQQPYPQYPLPIADDKLPRAVELYRQLQLAKGLAQRDRDRSHLAVPSRAEPLLVVSRTASGHTPVTPSTHGAGMVLSFDAESQLPGIESAGMDFTAYDGYKIKRRKRDKLSPEAKGKAALIRHLGSCWVCRNRRVPVSGRLLQTHQFPDNITVPSGASRYSTASKRASNRIKRKGKLGLSGSIQIISTAFDGYRYERSI